ncbi:MAG: NADP-specific glutamate dehydrogenase [Bacteroidetes bacterium]|nr:NADP-specific glutamate dehydrogenase [Bacteroidota bacterium]
MSDFMNRVIARSPGEAEFHQAVRELYETVQPVLEKHPKYKNHKILERMVEPERLISFRITWVDDQGNLQVNKGYRVQMNGAIGPFKGGLRFHPSVNQSILKFLAFEQIFKNSLTGLPMGGGKGGSDFDPKGKSDNEVMRFCQAFMSELYRHIDADTDVPAGDIGVGGREIGYLFGYYRKLKNVYHGVLTGKGQGWGGSLIRPEATGYGSVYFAQNMLQNVGDSLAGKICLVSGSGNVAQFTIEKLLHMGAKPVTASDSSGFIYDSEGINEEKLEFIKDLKNNKRGRISEYADKYSSATYTSIDSSADFNPLWSLTANCAFPSATQNEINEKDAHNLVKGGIKLVCEGANMPSTIEAINVFQSNGLLYAPGKASNAGGVAVSGLEMSQNSLRLGWTREEVDNRLKDIMKNIHDTALRTSEEYGDKGNYVMGANIAGFIKVADAMIDQGV